MFWGFTPALNLFDEFENLPDVLNILLVGGADCRHVLKTLAQRFKHKQVKINFVLMECSPETIAKQMLLLNIASQPPEEIGLIQKTRMFMELYGNTLLRPATAKYLTSCARQLLNMVTNNDYAREVMPFFNLEMKYRERDYLENLFKFWCSADEFNIIDIWDRRLRKSLGVRYDSKSGVFDWDLHMRFRAVGGHQVCNQEYHSFRSQGVAFTWLESEVSKPNRSFVCGVINNGEKFGHYGYLGEMQTGPFVAYGLHCKDKEFLKRTNNVNTHRATDVTERNLKEIFYELIYEEDYVHQNISSFTLGHLTQTPGVKVVDVGAAGETTLYSKTVKCVPLNGINITFISLGNLKLMKHRKQYDNFFHLVYFSSMYLKYFEADVITKICVSNAILLFENQLFVLNHRDKDLEDYGKRLVEITNDLKCKEQVNFDILKDSYIKFILKQTNC